jgi:acetyl/propionyl-CoA carboxylase alpha subunit
VLEGIRYDAGVESGSDVGVHYDPLLAKIIAHAPTRREATQRLRRALATLGVGPITTNREFLLAVLDAPAFEAGELSTHFIDSAPERGVGRGRAARARPHPRHRRAFQEHAGGARRESAAHETCRDGATTAGAPRTRLFVGGERIECASPGGRYVEDDAATACRVLGRAGRLVSRSTARRGSASR